MDFSRLIPAPSDRALFAGQTGSGKTTLARELLSHREYVVVLDGKGTIDWPGYERATTLQHLYDSHPEKQPRLIFRPDYATLANERAMDDFFRWVYDRRRTTLYVDETASVTRGDIFPFHYGACLMRGRERGVEVWSATQRPMRIPIIAQSEAEHAYIFRLRMPQDRQRIEQTTGIDADDIARLDKHFFLYAPQDGEIMGPHTLTFHGSQAPAQSAPAA